LREPRARQVSGSIEFEIDFTDPSQNSELTTPEW
jgi:hypothetical protein